MKKITYTVLFVGIVFLSGLLLYSILNSSTNWIDDRSNYLQDQYIKTDKTSYLIELSIIKPSRNSYEKIIITSLRDGNYNLATTYNYFVNLDDFNLIAAESAIERQDIHQVNKYLNRLHSEERRELEAFVSLDGESELWKQEPTTNLGKLSKMVLDNNFELYTVDSILGLEIKNIVHEYPKATEQSLMVAKLFNSYDFYDISRYISSDIIKKNQCVRDAYIINSESYNLDNNPGKAYSALNKYNKCDPVDTLVLNQLLDYAQQLKDTNKIDYITSKLDIISDIK